MDAETHQGPKSFKFITNDCQIQATMNEFQEQLKLRVMSLRTKNVYESVFDDSTLPEDLKIFLSNIKTVYDYIDVNKNDNEKIMVQQTGLIHLGFVMSFGPTSQIKKEIILSMELKEVGSVEGSNIKEHFDKLRQQLLDLNKKNKDEREKLRTIILTVQKTTQKLVCETQELKMDNIQMKKKLLVNEQKVNSLEILLKDLYTKFETLKEEKQELQKKMQQTKLVAIVPPSMQDSSFKKEIASILQNQKRQNQDSFLRRIKALEQQRDEERKIFQQKLAQKQKKLSSKITDIERTSIESCKQINSQMPLMNSYLKDSEIQKLRNTVSPFSSQQKSIKVKTIDLSNPIIPIELPQNGNGSQSVRKIGLTGKYYCGGKLCQIQNCQKCKGPCGPNSGQNCLQCMSMDIQKRGLKKGFLVNGNGQVAWMQQYGRFSCGIGFDNGAYNCGVNQKYCQWCASLTENYQHRYKQLL